MNKPDPTNPLGETGTRLLVGIQAADAGPPVLHDTGLLGFVDGDGDFILAFRDETTADECARIVAAAIRREHGRPLRVEAIHEHD